MMLFMFFTNLFIFLNTNKPKVKEIKNFYKNTYKFHKSEQYFYKRSFVIFLAIILSLIDVLIFCKSLADLVYREWSFKK